MSSSDKIYFISDLHLGMHPAEKSMEREKLAVKWLNEVQDDASEIYFLGDIFDYWHDYRKVVPRGFTRFLGKIAEITDRGIPVYFFTGNHDVWMYDYLPKEVGVKIFHKPIVREYGGKTFLIAHGDGLGPGQLSYKFLKGMFTSRVLQWLYARIHPNGSMSFAHWWSRKSRFAKGISTEFLGEDKEYLILFAREKLKKEHFDYFVFGHRHIPLDFDLNSSSKIIFLGDWIVNFTYGVFDGTSMKIHKYSK